MAASDIIFLGIGGPGGTEQIDAFILFGLTDGTTKRRRKQVGQMISLDSMMGAARVDWRKASNPKLR